MADGEHSEATSKPIVDVSFEELVLSREPGVRARARAVFAAMQVAELNNTLFTEQELKYYQGLPKAEAKLAAEAFSRTVTFQTEARKSSTVVDELPSDEVITDEVILADLPIEETFTGEVDKDDIRFEAPPVVQETAHIEDEAEADDTETAEVQDSEEATEGDTPDTVFVEDPILAEELRLIVDDADDESQLQDESVPDINNADATLEETDQFQFGDIPTKFLKEVGMYKDSLTVDDIPSIAATLGEKFTTARSRLDYTKMFDMFLRGDDYDVIATALGATSGKSIEATVGRFKRSIALELKTKDSQPTLDLTEAEPAVESEVELIIEVEPEAKTEETKPIPRPPTLYAPFPQRIVDEVADEFFAEKDKNDDVVSAEELTDSLEEEPTEPSDEGQQEEDQAEDQEDETLQAERLAKAHEIIEDALSPRGLVSYGEWIQASNELIRTYGLKAGLTTDETESLLKNLRRDSDDGYTIFTKKTHSAIEKLQPHVIHFLETRQSTDMSQVVVVKSAVLRLGEVQSFNDAFTTLKRRGQDLSDAIAERTIIITICDLLQSIAEEQ